MAGAGAVAFRYARALADVVTTPRADAAQQDPKVITAQLAEFKDLLAQNPDLQILFSTPAVPAAKKKAVLAELSPLMGLAQVVQNFLSVVLQHERLGLLGEIVEAYESLLNERLGIVVADITSARALGDAEKQQLLQALHAKTGKQVQMNFSLDPALISGVVARIGSTIYDGSIRGQLARLRSELTGGAAAHS